MHISIPVANTMEYIQGTQISPLISKGFCKVCYVSDEANRNGTVITKELAADLGRKLPGSPVVGYFNEEDQDFEGHNREIIVKDGKFSIVDTTKPYGFVPTDGDVWFEKFTDDGVEHEYLCCTVYIWTGAYPESQRILDKGNNQSMELTQSTGFWTNDAKTNGRIFIYNDALIEKLCVLGENVEPCFEGAQIKGQFSLESSPEFQEFKATMFSMLAELQETLSKGGNSRVFTEYAVEIGQGLWDAIYSYLEEKYPKTDSEWKCSVYGILGIYEENGQKFAILRDRDGEGLFRMDLAIIDDSFEFSEELVEVTQTFVPVAAENTAYSLEVIDAYETARYTVEPEVVEEPVPETFTEVEEPEVEETTTYNLEEVTEYTELMAKYEALQNDYNALQTENETLKASVESLEEFKLSAERINKQSMIDSFYMLSDEDKKDVIDNIDTYSLDDIEAKLSVICVRNKINFNLDEHDDKPQALFSLGAAANETDDAPEWVKLVRLNNK